MAGPVGNNELVRVRKITTAAATLRGVREEFWTAYLNAMQECCPLYGKRQYYVVRTRSWSAADSTARFSTMRCEHEARSIVLVFHTKMIFRVNITFVVRVQIPPCVHREYFYSVRLFLSKHTNMSQKCVTATSFSIILIKAKHYNSLLCLR